MWSQLMKPDHQAMLKSKKPQDNGRTQQENADTTVTVIFQDSKIMLEEGGVEVDHFWRPIVQSPPALGWKRHRTLVLCRNHPIALGVKTIVPQKWKAEMSLPRV